MKLPQLSSKTANRFIYMIGDEGAVLVYLEKDVVVRRLFAPTSGIEHTKTFTELFTAHPKAPIYVLIDMIDQSYVRHTLPPVTPLGVGKLVQRRLDRDFSKDDIKGSLSLGREKEGRKDWNFLLISLAYSQNLQGWINLVLELPNDFAGIYLVPVESENIIREIDKALGVGGVKEKKSRGSLNLTLGKKKKQDGGAAAEPSIQPSSAPSPLDAAPNSEWKILVSHNKVGGFRQVVLKGGKLVFTRMAQTMDDTNPEVLAGSVEQEMQNTVEYLKRLGYTPKAGLDAYIIASEDVKAAIATNKLGTQNAHLFSPFEIGELMGLKQAVLSGDRFGDIVLATIFGMLPKKRLKLNIPYTANIEKIQQTRKMVKIGAALLSLAIIGLIAMTALDLFTMSGDIDTVTTQKNQRAGDLQIIQDKSKELPADVDEVTELIAVYDELNKSTESPLTFIKRLKPNLTEGAVVKSLGWKRVEVKEAAAYDPNANVQPTGTVRDAFEITMEIDFLYTEKNWDIFIERTNRFMQTFSAAYPDYKITYTNLPGELNSTGGSAQVNFEDLKSQKNQPVRGEAYTLSVEMKGPEPKPATTEGAAAGQPAQ